MTVSEIETERLILRPMCKEDWPDLAQILQDPAVMFHYEKVYSDQDVTDWMEKQFERYKTGLGLLAMVNKETGVMVGQAGLTMQKVEDDEVLEIGYLLKKEFWHQGYAIEAARALKEFAFQRLQTNKVYCTIKTVNAPSIAVAKKLGMHIEKEYIKEFNGKQMPHYLFSVSSKKTDLPAR